MMCARRVRHSAPLKPEGIVNLTNRACRRPDLATYSVDAHRSCSLSPPSFPCRNH